MHTKLQTKKCPICLKRKKNLPKPIHFHQDPLFQNHWQGTNMNILGSFKKKNKNKNNKYTQVFTDHLTWCNVLVPLPDQTFEVVAKFLLNKIIKVHSTPEILTSDNAANFTSKLLNEACKLCNIEKVHIVSFHPAANDLVERQNCKILNVLSKDHVRQFY